jgi:protein-S-isoprenylcysteine O-methyltransferase Ste14
MFGNVAKYEDIRIYADSQIVRMMEPGQKPDRPGVLAPPPLLYAGALAAGLLLQWALPVGDPPNAPALAIGLTLFVAGTALGMWFLATFRRAGTPVDVSKPTERVVAWGPFRFSRNPGYLSLTVMYAGLAIAAESVWALVLLPAVAHLVRHTVIEPEERYLERKFGDEYLSYKVRTRRWI